MEILEKVRKDLYPSNDYIFDSIKIKNKTINIIYNEVLVDSKSINETIYYRLSNLKVWDLNNLSNKLPNCNIKSIKDKDIINYFGEDSEKVKADVYKLLRVKYALLITNENPLEIKKIEYNVSLLKFWKEEHRWPTMRK